MIQYAHKGLDGYASRHGFPVHRGAMQWPPPENGKPGGWVEIPSNTGKVLKPHFWGFHGAKLDATVSWIHNRNFIMELGGEVVETPQVVVCSRARLVEELVLPREAAARLCVDYMGDVINYPREMRFPADYVRAVGDTFSHLREQCGLEQRTALQPRSPWNFALKHTEMLLKRCENDRITTMEYGDNMEAVWHIAQGLLETAKAVAAPDPGWRAIKQVSYHCRQAVKHATWQMHELGHEDIGKLPPTLSRLAEGDKVAPAGAVASLYRSQSLRLNEAWKMPDVFHSVARPDHGSAIGKPVLRSASSLTASYC